VATVMLVEDDPLIVEFTEKNLIKDGLEVIVATTGSEALELLTKHRADIILLDIMLPDVHGFEVCRRIRQGDVPGTSLVPVDVPIVMLTAREPFGTDRALAGRFAQNHRPGAPGDH